MREQTPIKWWSSPRTILRHILMLDDTPESVALGTAIGMFIGLTPTVGIQMATVLFVAAVTWPWVRFNRIAALLTVYVSNPLTMGPIYWFLYWVGTWFVEARQFTWQDVAALVEFHNIREWWASFVGLFRKLGAPLLIGTAIVSTIGGVITYPVMLWLVRKVRHEDAQRRKHEAEAVAASSDSARR